MGFFDFLKSKKANVWVDNNTNLMWQLNVPSALMTWNEANGYVIDMNKQQYCGYNDWRLPTIEEQEWVHRYKNLDVAWKYKENDVNPNDFSRAFYWSSTLLGDRTEKILDIKSVSDIDMKNKVWNICISNGISGYDSKTDKQCVRLVRGDNMEFLDLMEKKAKIKNVDNTANNYISAILKELLLPNELQILMYNNVRDIQDAANLLVKNDSSDNRWSYTITIRKADGDATKVISYLFNTGLMEAHKQGVHNNFKKEFLDVYLLDILIVTAFYLINLADNSFKDPLTYSDDEIKNTIDTFLYGIDDGSIDLAKISPNSLSISRELIRWLLLQPIK